MTMRAPRRHQRLHPLEYVFIVDVELRKHNTDSVRSVSINYPPGAPPRTILIQCLDR
jgi:hypothetical protein